MFGAKELIGLGCLSFEKRRLGTATTLESSELIRIERTVGSNSFVNSLSCSKWSWPIYPIATSNSKETFVPRFLTIVKGGWRVSCSN